MMYNFMLNFGHLVFQHRRQCQFPLSVSLPPTISIFPHIIQNVLHVFFFLFKLSLELYPLPLGKLWSYQLEPRLCPEKN